MDDRLNDTSVQNVSKAKTASEVGFGLSLSGWIALPVLICFFIGRYIVNQFGLPNYVIYVLVILGVATSFYGLIKAVKNYAKRQSSENSNKTQN